MSANQNQFKQHFSLIGMDLFSQKFPDLTAFRRWLIFGTSEIDSNISPVEQIHRSLADEGIKRSQDNDQNLIDDLIYLGFKRGLKDAYLTMNIPNLSTMRIIINAFCCGSNNSNIINRGFIINSLSEHLKTISPLMGIGSSEFIQEPFESALKQALSFSNDTENEILVLLDVFDCSLSPQDTFPIESLGVGCLIFFNQNIIERSYADVLVTDRYIESDTNNSIFFEQTDLVSVPIINYMRAAYSINDKTYFPYPQEDEMNGELVKKPKSSQLRPWFDLPYTEKREVVLACSGNDEKVKYFLLEKGYLVEDHPQSPFLDFDFYFLPIGFSNSKQLDRKINEIESELTNCFAVEDFVETYVKLLNEEITEKHVLVLLGSSKEEILDELEKARDGIPKSFENQQDWQTPVGSFFTPNPLGSEEKISFIYPGAFSTYIGMGNEIFYLFPQLHQAMRDLTNDPGKAINQDTIFPAALTEDLTQKLQEELNNNPTKMISSGICFSYLYTVIIRDILKVKPDSAFGYSLGENSMMFSMGIWTQADAMRTSLETSPIFRDRVSGSQNAIREFWGLPVVDINSEAHSSIWANYVLMAAPEKVTEALENEPFVYLTHINTPRQVVIGGKPDGCLRVINSLKCMFLQAPYNHAIHCEPVVSELDAFCHLHAWPVESQPDIPIYTAGTYKMIENNSALIAENFAKMLTNPIDFPRLVDTAYDDGARVFIELGAGSNCSKWADATLKDKSRMTLSINQNNVPDHISILKLIARLVSNHIDVDLRAVFG